MRSAGARFPTGIPKSTLYRELTALKGSDGDAAAQPTPGRRRDKRRALTDEQERSIVDAINDCQNKDCCLREPQLPGLTPEALEIVPGWLSRTLPNTGS